MKKLTLSITLLFLFSTFLFAQEIKQKDKLNEETKAAKAEHGIRSVGDKVTFKDGSTVLMEIENEGSAGSIILPDVEKELSGTKLYNWGGNLFWGGNQLGTAGSLGGWTRTGTNVHLTNIGDLVGIGTTNPNAKLDVLLSGSVAWQRGIRLLNPDLGVGDRLLITLGAFDNSKNIGNIYFNYQGDGSLQNRLSLGLYDVSDVLNIMADGNVGIGTTTPGAKLEVAGQLKITGGSPGAGKVLISDATGLASWEASSSGSGNTLDQAYDQGGAGLGRTIVADAGEVYISGPDGLTVDGDLLIGAGSGTDNDFIFFDDADEGLLWNETEDRFDFTNAVTMQGPLQAGSSGPSVDYNKMGIKTPTSGAMTSSGDLFISNDLEVGGEIYGTNGVLTINGNVGIGTTAPTAELEVEGDFIIHKNEVTISSDGDYIILQSLTGTITIDPTGAITIESTTGDITLNANNRDLILKGRNVNIEAVNNVDINGTDIYLNADPDSEGAARKGDKIFTTPPLGEITGGSESVKIGD